jgi:hypothetical protein
MAVEFELAQERLLAVHVTRSSYASWLWQADIVVSTASRRFFGATVVEVLFGGLVTLLRMATPHIEQPQQIDFRDRVACCDWFEMTTVYAIELESVTLLPNRCNVESLWTLG